MSKEVSYGFFNHGCLSKNLIFSDSISLVIIDLESF